MDGWAGGRTDNWMSVILSVRSSIRAYVSMYEGTYGCVDGCVGWIDGDEGDKKRGKGRRTDGWVKGQLDRRAILRELLVPFPRLLQDANVDLQVATVSERLNKQGCSAPMGTGNQSG